MMWQSHKPNFQGKGPTIPASQPQVCRGAPFASLWARDCRVWRGHCPASPSPHTWKSGYTYSIILPTLLLSILFVPEGKEEQCDVYRQILLNRISHHTYSIQWTVLHQAPQQKTPSPHPAPSPHHWLRSPTSKCSHNQQAAGCVSCPLPCPKLQKVPKQLSLLPRELLHQPEDIKGTEDRESDPKQPSSALTCKLHVSPT